MRVVESAVGTAHRLSICALLNHELISVAEPGAVKVDIRAGVGLGNLLRVVVAVENYRTGKGSAH
jgi:hypothetical protein